MKLNKIFALMLAATMFTACSDDDKSWNSSDVTVNMLQSEVSVKENNGIFNVPVAVDGEMNGPVQVTVEVAEVGENPAMDDVHYLVTEKTIVIVAEEGAGNIEIRAVDDGDINEARTFTVTIVDVKGGNLGSNATTVVTLKDNDSVFYEKLQARWKMNVTSRYDGEVSWNVNVVGYQEDQPGYNQTLFVTGILGYDFLQLELNYYFDMETKTGYVEIPLGQSVGAYDASNDIVACGVTDDGYLVLDGTVKGTWNDDMTQITFEDKDIVFYVMNPRTGAGLGTFDWVWSVTMTR